MGRQPSPRDLQRLARRLLDLLGRGTSHGRKSLLFRLRPAQAVVLGIIVGLVFILAWLSQPRRPSIRSGVPASSDGYLFCSWNVENFFDDHDDPKNHDEDEDYFGNNQAAYQEKANQLADALLLLNNARGPDILVMVEVESRRCVETLRDVLNRKLSSEWQYTGIVQHDNRTGRRFAPAVLTRLAVRDDLTRGGEAFGNRRILEAHLEADGIPLVVLASHWTSRLRGDTESKRAAYADALYSEYLKDRRSVPDVILSGDFNDEPDDPSLRNGLHAVNDPALVRDEDSRPNLLDLVTSRDPSRDGTYLFRGRWEFLDHILASPGLLDPSGWQILPETLETAHDDSIRAGRSGAPRRFGNERNANPRGPSDHFALTVRLKVSGHETP